MVSVWWSVTPTLPLPWLVVALMAASIDRDFPALIARMEAAAKGEPIPDLIRRRLAIVSC